MHHWNNCVRRGTATDFLTFSFVASHAYAVEPASTYELESVIESPNAIDADQMSRKELKTAIVSRAFTFVLYAASRLPSLTSFCEGVSIRLESQ
jgi:hypothetical protein